MEATNIDSIHTSGQQMPSRVVLPQGRCTKRVLNFGDTLLSLFVISPLVITHWRGTWAFMEHHEAYFPAWYCFVIGASIHTAFAILKEVLHTELVASPSMGLKWRITRHICQKLYTYIFSIGCIMHWQGGWALLLHYFGILLQTFQMKKQ